MHFRWCLVFIFFTVSQYNGAFSKKTSKPKKQSINSQAVEIKRQAFSDEFPYVVSLQVNNVHLAPGAIINKYFVFVEGYFVTILNASNTVVVSGKSDLRSGYGGTAHHITRMVKHENLVWPHNNVGLLRVCPPFANNLRKAKLPLNGLRWPTHAKGNFIYYDENGKLINIEAEVLADKECDQLNLPNNWNSATQMCTAYKTGNTCIFPHYPLLVVRGRLAGAQTWGVCDDHKVHSLMSEQFVDVAMYTKWIRKHSRIEKNKCMA